LTQGLTIADVQEWPDVLQAVTADDLIAAAKRVFDRKAAVTGWMIKTQEDLN
jgi:zinc protease